MRWASFALLAVVGPPSLLLNACREERGDAADQQNVSSVRGPALPPAPSNENSVQWLALDRASRFATVQYFISQAHNQCAVVTQAEFIGGLGGTDEWRATCSDTGDWTIWLKPEGADIVRCSGGACD